MKSRSSEELPYDFLDRRWVKTVQSLFGPIHPGYMIVLFILALILLSLFAIRLLEWALLQLSMSAVCISAFSLGVAGNLLDSGYMVPDHLLPMEVSKKRFELRDTLQIVVVVVGMPMFLAVGALLSGLLGIFAVLAFFVVGAMASFLYLTLTSQVHLCICCGRPAIFRKLRGRWTCLLCGSPR
jgi:hypothetical protein